MSGNGVYDRISYTFLLPNGIRYLGMLIKMCWIKKRVNDFLPSFPILLSHFSTYPSSQLGVVVIYNYVITRTWIKERVTTHIDWFFVLSVFLLRNLVLYMFLSLINLWLLDYRLLFNIIYYFINYFTIPLF